MAEEFEMPDDVSDGNFLELGGQYHFLVTAIDEEPTHGDKLFNGIDFQCEARAGTVQGQAGKTCRLSINNPNLSHKDGGKFAGRVKARMALALGLINPNAKGTVSIEWQNGVGRSFVACVEHGKDRDGSASKFLNVEGAKIYHVTDPAMAHVALDPMALKAGGYDVAKVEAARKTGAAAGGTPPANQPAANGNGSKPAPLPAAPAPGQHPAKGATFPDRDQSAAAGGVPAAATAPAAGGWDL